MMRLRSIALPLIPLLAVLLVALLVGPRYAVLLLIGLTIGGTLEALRFGFAGPWRAFLMDRNPSGLIAQFVCMGIVSIAAFPLLAAHPSELIGAHAPIGFAMVGGAVIFGFGMQLLMACGSGMLVNAGSGNAVAALSLPFFAFGSFSGAYHLNWWTDLGSLPVFTLSGLSGLGLTLVGLLGLGILAWAYAPKAQRVIPPRLWLAAGLVAGLAIFHLIVAGQPWGVVFGLGLWVAKGATSLGVDVSESVFWAAQQGRLGESLLMDATSLTNIGLMGGAALVTALKAGFHHRITPLPARTWASICVIGFMLGYSSRLAFGCNVGAYFSGISTGSLHGWVWLVCAFAGAWLAVNLKLRSKLGFPK